MFNDGVDQNECRTDPFFRAYSANGHFKSHTQGSPARPGLQIFRRYAAIMSRSFAAESDSCRCIARLGLTKKS